MAGRVRRRGRGSGTVAAVAAVGLIAFSGPVTEVAATVTASRTALPAVPAPAAALPRPVTVAAPPPAVVPPVSVVDIPRPRPIEVRVRPGVPYGVQPDTDPPPSSCGGYANPRQVPPGVVPGVASATVSWQADGHAEVQRYRVQAVSQQLVSGLQPDPPSLIAAQPAGCAPVTVTFAGLTPGVPYVFWLEEEVPDSFGVLRWVQVGTSSAVVIA